MTNGSPAYQRFWDSYIDPRGNFEAWHDGLDPNIFSKLSAAELEQAEADLLRHLPDGRAVEGLAAIRSQKANAPLQKLERNAHGADLVRIALALKHIGADYSSAEQRIIGVLHYRETILSNAAAAFAKSARMDAAIALREFPTSETAEALQQAITNDPEYLVRYHALASLLTIYGYSFDAVDKHASRFAPRLGRSWNEPAKTETLREIEALIASRPIGLGST